MCAACPSDQDCDTKTGTCVCDATSCPSGCCSGGTCVPYASQTGASCGAAGAACAACTNDLCDTKSGTCACDANTCADGCCTGGAAGTCEAFKAQGAGSCGASGATCGSCAGGCCSTGGGGVCDTTHDDGFGHPYYDCEPLGTYTSTSAGEACAAYKAATGSSETCKGGFTCNSNTALCLESGGTPSLCWVYSGNAKGDVVNGSGGCNSVASTSWQ
jgi:hypothetical protein